MHLSNLFRLRRFLALSALITTGLAVTGPSVAAQPAMPSLSRLLDDCTARNGVSGAATDDNGMPIVGAPVMVHSEPDPVRGAVGERVALRLLGWTRTDEGGCYAIPLHRPSATLRITLQREGSVEIVTVPEPADQMPIHQSFGLQADRARESGAARRGTVGLRPDTMPIDLAGDRPLLRGDTQVVKIYRKRPVLVGQWFSSMKGVRQVWRYSQGATTSLSSAFSQTGRPGSYSRSVTYDRSAHAAVAFPVAHGKAGNYYRSYFRYAKYVHWYCDGVACGVGGYTVRPYSWERGTQVTTGLRVPAVKRNNCSPYRKGSTDSSRGSQAVTWRNGVSIGGDLAAGVGLNISFSSQTGFTNAAENVVTFQKRGFLCGVQGPLSGRPGMLVARQFAR